MIRLRRAAAVALLLAITPLAPVAAQESGVAQSLRTVPLVVATQGKLRRFRVEVAETPQQQETGLMFRKTMPADHGMIFVMQRPRPASFWMRNTLLPLDLIFIGPDKRIIKIAENAQPMSLDLIECAEPVAAVLELNGGMAARQGIAAGDRVSW